ncbi:hypothetical protein scyTo_0004268 [Scyliorhinus torazame]|uniref:Uncharacterized protein n=1 Tax=Scyliorhinus torazame TaxID=75743 RepID=A0A401NNW7_SCYTO|nr:hypothetical protein [Scyliorhinus torazame]
MCNTFSSELHHPKKMNKGPTLLSCGIMEGDGWRDIRKCQIDLEQTTNNLDPPWTCLTSSEECQENTVWPNASGVNLLRPLSVSHEQISVLELSMPSNTGKSAANAEPAQPKSQLLRCRSQPCVHNDQKVGMKRRRPEEEQRPSLDLAKMTQNLRNFHSPSSVGAPGNECCQRKQTISLNPNKVKTWAPHLYVPSPPPGTTPTCKPEPQHHGDSEKPSTSKGESSGEETTVFGIVKKSWPGDENDKDSWRRGEAGQDIFQLDGELDIEEIENN